MCYFVLSCTGYGVLLMFNWLCFAQRHVGLIVSCWFGLFHVNGIVVEPGLFGVVIVMMLS